MKPHPEEVRATRWVTQQELFRLMDKRKKCRSGRRGFVLLRENFWKRRGGARSRRCRRTGRRSIGLTVLLILGGQGGAAPFLDDLEKQVRSAPKQEARILKSAFRQEMLHDIASTTSYMAVVLAEAGGLRGRCDLGVPSCCGVFTSLDTTRGHLTSVGGFFFDFEAGTVSSTMLRAGPRTIRTRSWISC